MLFSLFLAVAGHNFPDFPDRLFLVLAAKKHQFQDHGHNGSDV